MPEQQHHLQHRLNEPPTAKVLAKMSMVVRARYLAYEQPADEKVKTSLSRAQERNQQRMRAYLDAQRHQRMVTGTDPSTPTTAAAPSPPADGKQFQAQCVARLKESRIRVQQLKDADLHWLVERQATSLSAMVLKNVMLSSAARRDVKLPELTPDARIRISKLLSDT
ncbi:hypothetical protein RI367_003939 [Sorochytrium milnesiophthora]